VENALVREKSCFSMNVAKFTLWSSSWGCMCCTSCSLCTRSFSLLCTPFCIILFGICNGQLLCQTEYLGCPEMIPECAWCCPVVCLAYMMIVLSRHCQFLGTVDTIYEYTDQLKHLFTTPFEFFLNSHHRL
jgi:hypothetical protein